MIMKEIYFDENIDVYSARYCVSRRRKKDSRYHEIVIFITQNMDDGASLINSSAHFDPLINIILKNEVSGIQMEHIRILLHHSSIGSDSFENSFCWDIKLMTDTSGLPSWTEPGGRWQQLWFKLKGKPVHKWVHSRYIGAGNVHVWSDFENSHLIPKDELAAILEDGSAMTSS